jgi:hypothetical protein
MKELLASILVSVLLLVAPVAAQEAPKPAEEEGSDLLTGVQDNSFLIEEGYNQEPNQVQHISLFLRDRDDHEWTWAFTQEWPVGSMKHQLSYTVPVAFGGDSGTVVGDVALNYRYQLVGNGESRLAIAPRLSLILPTGGDDEPTGVEVGLPISQTFGSRVIAHTNFAARWLTKDADPEYLAGQSVVLAITPRFNALVEALWTGTGGADHTVVVSPGIRWAYNFPSGLQIVPGAAYVMGIGDRSEGADALLLYLSFEHLFRHAPASRE